MSRVLLKDPFSDNHRRAKGDMQKSTAGRETHTAGICQVGIILANFDRLWAAWELLTQEWARCVACDKEVIFSVERWEKKISFSFMNSSIPLFTRGSPDGYENLFCCKLKGSDCPVNVRS